MSWWHRTVIPVGLALLFGGLITSHVWLGVASLVWLGGWTVGSGLAERRAERERLRWEIDRLVREQQT